MKEYQVGATAPRSSPQRDGSLRVSRPSAATRYDFGNTRLFAQVDGAGNLRHCHLAEGVRALAHWRGQVAVEGAALHWARADAIGRLFTLTGGAAGTTLEMETFCAGETPAVYQRWRAVNSTSRPRTVSLTVTVGLDLHRPAQQLAQGSLMNRMRRLVSGPVGTIVLGKRRWRIENWIGARHKNRPPAVLAPLEAQPRALAARADGAAAQLHVLELAQAQIRLARSGEGHARLQIEVVLDPGSEAEWCLALLLSGPGSEPDSALLDWRAARADAQAFSDWLREASASDDPLIRSLVVAGLNSAAAMYKELPSGFAGLWAGPGYAYPPRIYFRDSYWTAQALLPFLPGYVRRNLLALAGGVHADGQCPSGVFDPALFTPEELRQPGACDWLPDHHDSPSFFVLMLADYLRWSDDWGVLDERAGDATIWQVAQRCLRYLYSRDRDGDGLPEKTDAPNDWDDNVVRGGLVTYDLGLYYGALDAAAAIADRRGELYLADAYRAQAKRVAEAANALLWDEQRGYYINYAQGDFREDHLALDSLMALRYGMAPPDRRRRVLAAARQLLQTRHNAQQPWGDWGVMCCFPGFRRPLDLFSKSREPYHYHNGAEWPYLSGVYGQLLLEEGDPDWYYVLTRWWERQLNLGLLTPVEYISPPYPPGALLQGWSSMPAAALFHAAKEEQPDIAGVRP